jgi:tetratricopeptide (TPR) repeat protein
MLPDKQKPELTPEESMFIEAKEAVHANNLARARDLMTRLLQTNQQNPEYWVWLSAAMETPKERLYCLQTAYKIDPSHPAAKRGLAILGSLPQAEVLPPFPMNHPRPWEARLKQAEEKPKTAKSPAFRLIVAIGAIVLLLIGAGVGVSILTKKPVATQAPIGTPRPTVTPYATNSNADIPVVNTLRPLADLISTPYTPTPIYAATPHGDIAGDSYRGAMRAYKNGQWENVANMMAQVATAQPGSVDALYFIGEAKRLSGQYQAAINEFNTAIALNPKFAPSYLGRARADHALNPKKNILEDLTKTIDLDPNYAEAYMERGMYYIELKDFKAAQADLQMTASLGDSPMVELSLAKLYLAQQDNEAALEAAKRANQMDLSMLEGYLVLGMAYRANNQTIQAVEVLETYLKYQPDNAEAFAVLGAAYYNRGEFDKAEVNLLESLRLNQYNVDGYFWLGQTYLQLEKFDKAISNFQKARDMDEASFDIGEGLAKAYMGKLEFNNAYIAIIKVEKSAETPQQKARFIYIRALSLDQLNQPEAAYRDWLEISKMTTDATTDEMIQTALRRLTELRTATPTITATSTKLPTMAPGTLRPTITPKPSDTRVPTITPKVTPTP